MTSDNDKSVNDLTKRAEELAHYINLRVHEEIEEYFSEEVFEFTGGKAIFASALKALIQMETETIEECAKVAESEIDCNPQHDIERAFNHGSRLSAKAIRALNDKEK